MRSLDTNRVYEMQRETSMGDQVKLRTEHRPLKNNDAQDETCFFDFSADFDRFTY